MKPRTHFNDKEIHESMNYNVMLSGHDRAAEASRTGPPDAGTASVPIDSTMSLNNVMSDCSRLPVFSPSTEVIDIVAGRLSSIV